MPHTHENFDDIGNIEQSVSSLKYINEKTENEKVNILYSHLLISVISSFICSSVIFFILPISIFKTIWYNAVIFISIFRFSLVFIRKYNPKNPNLHLILFTLGSTLSACCWSIVGYFLIPDHNLLKQMVIIMIIAGVSSGAMQTLQANLISAISFLVLTILPLSIWLFTQSVFEYYALGIALITYLFFCIFSVFRGNRLINQVLTLNFKNFDLAFRLYTSNDELTNKNNQLERHEENMNVINHLNEKLQLCKNSIEAHSVIKIAAERLFIDFSGGLTITDALDHQVLVAQWGNKQTLNIKFSSDSCWALRGGNKYLVNQHKKDLLCKHYTLSPEGSYCIPLIVENKSLGMINFNFSNDIVITNQVIQIMTVFSDVIKLALANLQLREKLQSEATRDPLTNLFNRRYLNESLSREFYRMIREKNSLCFAILDLDHFKKLNDTYGHETGDEVLKYFGTLLMNHVRGSDIACRFGGEEFALVFVNTTIDKIMPSLEHIRKEMESAKIYVHNQLIHSITTSIGVAQAPEQGKTVQDIIKAADIALYAAKKAGRNTIVTAQLAPPEDTL